MSSLSPHRDHPAEVASPAKPVFFFFSYQLHHLGSCFLSEPQFPSERGARDLLLTGKRSLREVLPHPLLLEVEAQLPG